MKCCVLKFLCTYFTYDLQTYASLFQDQPCIIFKLQPKEPTVNFTTKIKTLRRRRLILISDCQTQNTCMEHVSVCPHQRTLAVRRQTEYLRVWWRLLLFSSVKQSGSNFSSCGKYVGSWCRAIPGYKPVYLLAVLLLLFQEVQSV